MKTKISEVLTPADPPNEEVKPMIFYLCDGKACGPGMCHTRAPLCKHTPDINHAISFHGHHLNTSLINLGPVYFEEDNWTIPPIDLCEECATKFNKHITQTT